MPGFNVILAPFNVIWEGSDSLSGDGRNLTLMCAHQMGRHCGVRRRWEGISRWREDGKAVIFEYQMGRCCAT